ncbi:MAG: S9 family peptidase [Hyphomicrobiales bacterium]
MTKEQQKLPGGAWPSPVSADLVAGQSLRFGMVRAFDDYIYWSEGRPSEGGRVAIMRQGKGGKAEDLLPEPYSARSRVHEYGGGEYLVTGHGVFFVNAPDQDIYLIKAEGSIERITDEKSWRFADFCLDEANSRLIAVGEHHEGDHDPKPENVLVSVGLTGPANGAVSRLVSGADFYASPTISADGKKLAWLEWSLPGMPWDDGQVKSAELEDSGALGTPVAVAGGNGSAAFQPEWAGDGTLYFVWDKTGWGQLFRWRGGEPEQVIDEQAEFGLPLWGLGARSYALLSDNEAFATCFLKGESRATLVDLQTGKMNWLETGLANIYGPVATGDGIAALVTGHREAPFVARINRKCGVSALRKSAELDFTGDDISPGQVLALEGKGGRTVWTVYYPPQNASYTCPDDEAPPLIASAHGGPTGMADRGLKLKVQYWTSRGFAYLDVDYAGSWGYGRAYMTSLNGFWGVADVEDAVAGAEAMVARGLAHKDKLFISGGSAGGYTVLCALAFHDVFRAGASYYGIGDLNMLLELTHKFESGYIYALTGTTAGNTEPVLTDRSPLAHAEGISVPVIFFQGAKDFVVPPDQSRDMVASLKNRGVPVAYLEFPEEAHGFRAADVISRCLEAEYAFYARILELPAEGLAQLKIENEGAL